MHGQWCRFYLAASALTLLVRDQSTCCRMDSWWSCRAANDLGHSDDGLNAQYNQYPRDISSVSSWCHSNLCPNSIEWSSEETKLSKRLGHIGYWSILYNSCWFHGIAASSFVSVVVSFWVVVSTYSESDGFAASASGFDVSDGDWRLWWFWYRIFVACLRFRYGRWHRRWMIIRSHLQIRRWMQIHRCQWRDTTGMLVQLEINLITFLCFLKFPLSLF
jgi:hypothetical protein